MHGFEVDLGQLQIAAGAVRGACEVACAQVTAAPHGVSATGDPSLAVALAGFTSSWTGGLGHLRTDLASTATSVGTTALAYAAVDERVAAALRAAGAGPR